MEVEMDMVMAMGTAVVMAMATVTVAAITRVTVTAVITVVAGEDHQNAKEAGNSTHV
jgi:hypothetical protein